MSKEIISSLYDRKSVRVFNEKVIEDDVKNTLFECAFQAPTAGCQQLYTILDITDAEVKAKLAVLCDNQPFIKKASMVVVFLADTERWLRLYSLAGETPRKPGVGDLMLAVSDANIAAQNMVVAAESLGIGSCYIGDVMEHCEGMRELLSLPNYVFPCAMLVLGYHNNPKHKKPQRFAKEMIVMENNYTAISDERMIELLSERQRANSPNVSFDFNNYVGAFCKRKYESDFSLEMTRSVEQYIKSFQAHEE